MIALSRRLLGFFSAAILLLACRQLHAEEAKGAAAQVTVRQAWDRQVVESVYDQGRSPRWLDYGYAPRGKPAGPGPERIDFSGWSGWILCRPDLQGTFGGLGFRYQAPKEFGNFLKIYLANEQGDEFPPVDLRDELRVPAADGWTEVWISMDELNPSGLPFDRLRWQAIRKVSSEWVQIDKIGLTAPDPKRRPGPKLLGPPVDSTLEVQCRSPGHRISPYIYGLASSSQLDAPRELSPTTVRWGGNPSTRYNWELGAWNNGSDWFFRNVNKSNAPAFHFSMFLDDVGARGIPAAVTLPTIGWVAKDTTSLAFPVSIFGAQQETDPSLPEAGNGISASGQKLVPGPPTRTSVPAPPEFIARWVKRNREADRKRGFRTARWYILDNEPMLWNDTHRDVHPRPVTYDELLERTLAYAQAVRAADPEALISGPAEWGWNGFLYSAADMARGGAWLRPDRRAHGDVPLLPWYLSQLREHEKKTGVKLLDVVDVHYYPMGKGMGLGAEGKTDLETNARRIRSTRSLWDPTYKDESWIAEEVRLIPRLKEWIAENYPGLGISIGEYNWGAENHLSGGLALAEVLGRFGEQDITSAYYWRYPIKDSAAWWAFRTYRNYDGKGAAFLERSVPTRGQGLTSLFASRDEAGKKLVLIVLNFEPNREARIRIALDGCGPLAARRTFTYQGGPQGFAGRAPGKVAEGVLSDVLPPYTINVIELGR